MSGLEKAKRRAAKGALPFLEEARLVGLGTGTTVEKLIEILEPGDDRAYVPSSIDTALKAAARGLRVVHPSSVRRALDVYVDGADEVDPKLNMIKGGGAALTMEKILAYHSRLRVFIVDYTKLVGRLGEKRPLPIEVVKEAVGLVLSRLEELGYEATPRTPGKHKYGPIVSDTGGVILDVKIPEDKTPERIEEEIRSIPGVVETGLFIGLADAVIVGYPDKTELLSRGWRKNA